MNLIRELLETNVVKHHFGSKNEWHSQARDASSEAVHAAIAADKHQDLTNAAEKASLAALDKKGASFDDHMAAHDAHDKAYHAHHREWSSSGKDNESKEHHHRAMMAHRDAQTAHYELSKVKGVKEETFHATGDHEVNSGEVWVLVKSDRDREDYHGVNVIFKKNGHGEPTASCGDSQAKAEWKNHKAAIIRAASQFAQKHKLMEANEPYKRNISDALTHLRSAVLSINKAKNVAKNAEHLNQVIKEINTAMDSLSVDPGPR